MPVLVYNFNQMVHIHTYRGSSCIHDQDLLYEQELHIKMSSGLLSWFPSLYRSRCLNLVELFMCYCDFSSPEPRAYR